MAGTGGEGWGGGEQWRTHRPPERCLRRNHRCDAQGAAPTRPDPRPRLYPPADASEIPPSAACPPPAPGTTPIACFE